MDDLLAESEQRLIYTPDHTGNSPITHQNAAAFWTLFTPRIGGRSIDNTDIIVTSSSVKAAISSYGILSNLSDWAIDIIVTYITFELLA